MHIPVLLTETLTALSVKHDGIYVDATFGRGGHSYQIHCRLGSEGKLIAFDADQDAIEASKSLPFTSSPNFTLINDNFVNMKDHLTKQGISAVDGVIFDLGVSSPQLDVGTRGFSYHQDAKLDMRFNQQQSLSAYDVVNRLSEAELTRIFFEYGEERYSKPIAKGIVLAREKGYITTTLQLVEIIKKSVPIKYLISTHPARRVFQAIRIYVNNELENLNKALQDALSLLKVGGRLVVISFHSLEDRIVKEVFNSVSKETPWKKNQPLPVKEEIVKYAVVNKKIITADNEELKKNPRSSSAKMRIIERREL